YFCLLVLKSLSQMAFYFSNLILQTAIYKNLTLSISNFFIYNEVVYFIHNFFFCYIFLHFISPTI
ncbi:hypothetical protein FEE23_05825, partial [Lactobacillus murinus]|nr:hypothetical protein [Ligilactobacillus murinus]NEF84879.1 hypothetical protein [Ligilactobacillus murinus]NEF87026.1 hypothetical protein [Ligilactobacillus murinus]NEF89244.1 hypothetical protein [Ligilactobacillus murinus]NEF91574.1 hypothetical protein [Ligilactobacillus murinus]